MGNEQKIIDKIISDAKADANVILENARKDAEIKINAAKEKADKEMAAYIKLAQAEAEKAAAKEISGAEMSAKKMILAKKQEILEETIRIQLSKSPEEAKKFIEAYTNWDDLHEYIASVHKRLGNKPYKRIRTYF